MLCCFRQDDSGTAANTNGAMQHLVKQQKMAQQQPFKVGIDFGTARSGYAFTLGQDSQVKVQMSYPGETDATPKTLTALLYLVHSPTNWEPVSWGMSAYKKYNSLSPKERGNYMYLKTFKLALVEDAPQTYLPPNCPFKPREVVAHFLKFMLQHIEETLKVAYASKYSRSKVQWCLTVPARCSEVAKEGMRIAAQEAGLVSDAHSPKLVLAHEPEAAALTVREQEQLEHRYGDTFLVVDAGGGTVDITVHTVVERQGKGVLSEATHRDGLLAGSVFIDKKFKSYLSKYVGKDVFSQWYQKYTHDFIRLVHEEWERVKRQFGNEQLDEVPSLPIPNSLFRLLPDHVKAKLTSEQDGWDDRIRLNPQVMESFFRPIVDQIIDLMDQIIIRAREKVDKILIVGGLGSSLYLYKRIRQAFPHVRDVVTPKFGYAAIVEGAVLYAKDPQILYQRCSLMTYGLKVTAPWAPGGPEEEKFWDPTYNCYLTNLKFSKFVEKDELVSVDDVVRKRFIPVSADQKECKFEVYATEASDAEYVTDQGVSLVGIVTAPLNIAPGTQLSDYCVTVMFKFGESEIQVSAVEEKTGSRVDTSLVFASTPVKPVELD